MTSQQPAQARRSSATTWRSWVAIVVVLAAMVAIPQWAFGKDWGPKRIPYAPPTPIAAVPRTPFVSPEPVVSVAPHRSQPRRALVGPTFTAADSTTEAKLEPAPFVFQIPQGWDCSRTEYSTPAPPEWLCHRPGTGADVEPWLDLIVWHCGGPCTEAQRAEADDQMAFAARPGRDPTTRLTERTTDLGQYVLSVDRVFTDTAGGPADWLLVIEARARPAAKAVVQKIANDIYSQTVPAGVIP